MIKELRIFKLLLFAILLCFSFYLKGNSKNKIDSIAVSESVFLHIDRSIYIAGENLLFGFYLVNTQSNHLSDGSEIGYVIVQNEKSVVIGKSQVKIENGIASGAIYLADTLKTGYYHVIAYTNYMRNMSNSNFFTSQILVANRFDLDFSDLIFKNQTYKQFEKMKSESNVQKTVKISPSDLFLKKQAKANFTLNINDSNCNYIDLSISVIEKTSNTTNVYPFIYQNFKLGSDSNRTVFLKEDKFTEMQGFLSDAATGKRLPHRQLILTTSDTLTNFNFAQTNQMGQFRFAISDYYADRDLYIKIKADADNNSTSKITLVPKFPGSKQVQTFAWPIDSNLINYIKRSQEIIRIQKAFNQSTILYTKNNNKISSPRLYKYPDYSVNPSDYAELKDFTEISREIVPSLKTRNTDNTYSAVLYDATFKEYLPSSPAIFVDGIFIDNINSIIHLGSKDIKRIDVISSPWYFNNLKLSGVVSIFTKNNLWKTIVNANDYFKIRLEPFFDFPLLNAKKVNPREPDFRQLLYWNPHNRLSKGHPSKFNFYTSDYAAKYLIKVSGITDNGEIIEESIEFEVTD